MARRGKQAPDPYLWFADSRTLLTGAPGEDEVLTDADGATRVFTLPVNISFAPPDRVDRQRGVDYADEDNGMPLDPPEYWQGTQAMRRVIASALLRTDTLAKWTAREAAERGGNPQLARALIGRPGAKTTDVDYRNQLRNVQRWQSGGIGSKGNAPLRPAKGIYAERVAALRGTPEQAATRMLQQAQSLVGIRGDWQEYEFGPRGTHIHFHRHNAADEVSEWPVEVEESREHYEGGHYTMEGAATAVLQGRADWAGTVVAAYISAIFYHVWLLRIYALHAEVTL